LIATLATSQKNLKRRKKGKKKKKKTPCKFPGLGKFQTSHQFRLFGKISKNRPDLLKRTSKEQAVQGRFFVHFF
jgi:hypothetical protein